MISSLQALPLASEFEGLQPKPCMGRSSQNYTLYWRSRNPRFRLLLESCPDSCTSDPASVVASGPCANLKATKTQNACGTHASHKVKTVHTHAYISACVS